MDTLTLCEFEGWLCLNHVQYNRDEPMIAFVGEEYTFRVPIGDYRLQLDYRLNAALSLLPQDMRLLLLRRNLRWDLKEHNQRPLDTVLCAFKILPVEGVLRLSSSDRQLAIAMSYLTNRWGRSGDSLYVLPETNPQVMLYVPGSPESLFVTARTLEAHEHSVNTLKQRGVPAYGKHVTDPMPLPSYQDIQLGSSVVAVEPSTGKPIGAGGDESTLLREFLPPRRPRNNK